jgi:hypothetical protein
VRLCDIAGNCDTFQSASFMIDKTAPSLTGSVSPDILWPPNGKSVDVRLRIAVGDNLALPTQPITRLTVAVNDPDEPSLTLTPGAFQFDTGSSRSGVSEITIPLRAVQATRGGTRTYTLSGDAQDAAGHSISFSVDIPVARAR